MRMRWPQDDEIRWVEYELARAKHGADWEKSPIGHETQALEIWLAKVRDKKSWKEIGDQYYSKARRKREARRSEARRAYERVERYLGNPNAPEFKEHRLRQLILEKLGVPAEAFRTFILKGHLPRKD